MKRPCDNSLYLLLLLLVNSISFADPNIVDGLIGYWKFDEGVGSIAHDSSGNNNHGNIIGSSWVPGLYGYAFNFDGNDDYIVVPYTATLNDYPPISVSCWFKFFEFDSNAIIIANKGETWCISINDNHQLEFEGFNSYIHHVTNQILDTDQWYHLVFTYDGNQVKVFFNGVEDFNEIIGPTSLYDAYPLILGGNSPNPYAIGTDGKPYLFTGMLDEFRIYNRVLSQEDIQFLYNEPNQEGGPRIILQEPKVTSGVFTNVEGVNYLTLCWNERMSFIHNDLDICNSQGQSISFSVSGGGSQFMYIVFDNVLLNDAYTITVKDTAKGYETGKYIDGDGDGFTGGDAVIVMEHRQRHDSDNDNDIDLNDLAELAERWLWVK